MKRFHASTLGWRGGAIAGALFAALALAVPAAAKNTNLTATAKYSASSEWESDKGNTTFVAAKAFDGDITTRWNVASGDNDGSWIAANWDAPVTINKVVVREFLDRVNGFRVQTRDAGSSDWKDTFIAEGDDWKKIRGGVPNNAVFTARLDKPVETAGLRILFTDVGGPPTIWEVEAYNNPSGTLTGTVTDPSGAPIPGAVISDGSDSATTDAQGKYSLVSDAGTYNISAQKPGAFRLRVARAVDLPANGSAIHDFVLLPQPPNLSFAAKGVSSSDWEDGTDYNAAKANDGNLSTRWNSRADDAAGAYLEMQWPAAQTFNKIVIREFDDRMRKYSLQSYDKANDAYVNILSATVPKTSGDKTFTHILAQPITSERLRLTIDDTDSTSLSIYELEVSNTPIANANVVVKDVTSGNPIAKATVSGDLQGVLGTTDDKGQLALLVEPDDYVLSATAEGYFGGAPVSFTINAGENKDVALTAPATGPNLAKTAKASASSEDDSGDDGAAKAFDGDLNTFWLAKDVTNQWVAATWDKPTHFTVVQLRGFQNVINSSHLQILDTDGTTWVDVPNSVFSPESYGAPYNPPIDLFFPQGITTTGVRLFITATNTADAAPGVAEFIIYDSPLPKP